MSKSFRIVINCDNYNLLNKIEYEMKHTFTMLVIILGPLGFKLCKVCHKFWCSSWMTFLDDVLNKIFFWDSKKKLSMVLELQVCHESSIGH